MKNLFVYISVLVAVALIGVTNAAKSAEIVWDLPLMDSGPPSTQWRLAQLDNDPEMEYIFFQAGQGGGDPIFQGYNFGSQVPFVSYSLQDPSLACNQMIGTGDYDADGQVEVALHINRMSQIQSYVYFIDIATSAIEHTIATDIGQRLIWSEEIAQLQQDADHDGFPELLLECFVGSDPAECVWVRVYDLSPVSGMTEPLSHVSVSRLSSSPNPSQRSATINYVLPEKAEVLVQVNDVTGRIVDILVNQEQAAGTHSYTWEPKDAPAGVYFVVMFAQGELRSSKLVLTK